jgi:predicted nucleic acid-binding Zn ribbon protein
MSVAEVAKCKLCGEERRDANAPICHNCKLPQAWTPCKVCGKPIPEGVGYCNECKSYQKKYLRYLPVLQAVTPSLSALIAVITAAVLAGNWLWYYHSHTSATLIKSDPEEISVYLGNSGRSASAVIDVWLRYRNVPLQDVQLDPKDVRTRLILPNGNTIIELTLPKPKLKAVASAKEQSAHLDISVKESYRNEPKWFCVPLPKTFIALILGRKE